MIGFEVVCHVIMESSEKSKIDDTTGIIADYNILLSLLSRKYFAENYKNNDKFLGEDKRCDTG